MADEEIIAKAPSHPVTSSLLIVATLALCANIYLICDQLSAYLNPQTLPQVRTGDKIQQFKKDFPKDLKDDLPWNKGESN